jgi:hypothetical protein
MVLDSTTIFSLEGATEKILTTTKKVFQSFYKLFGNHQCSNRPGRKVKLVHTAFGNFHQHMLVELDVKEKILPTMADGKIQGELLTYILTTIFHILMHMLLKYFVLAGLVNMS